jgi:hypothetical protein
MTSRAVVLFVALTTCATALAEARLTEHADALRCGGITARLRTTCLEQLPTGWECVNQTLRVIEPNGKSRDVPLDAQLVPSADVPGLRTLDGYVTAWACITSQSGQHYLDLLYACQVVNGCGARSPSGEWAQLVNARGHVVAGGRNGSAPGSLERLGVARQLSNGIQVTGVGPNK